MDCIVHVVAKSWTWLSDFPFHVYVTQWNISRFFFFLNIFSIQFIYSFGNPTAVDIWLGCLHPWGRSARWVWQRSLPEWEPSKRDRNGITKGKTSRALSSSKRTRGVAWRGKKKKKKSTVSSMWVNKAKKGPRGEEELILTCHRLCFW